MTCTRIVELKDRSYSIHIGTNLFPRIAAWIHEAGLPGQLLLVSDDRVYPLYGERLVSGLSAAGFEVAHVVVPAGESSKCHAQLIQLYDAALEAGLERSSGILALGGGVVGDLAGFAAATYLRGIPCVQIPTTLLAMVDSAVGGKTGINLPQGKNLIGAFHQPALVVADTSTLRSLPQREFCAGLAEVVKYGVIADPELLDVLEARSPRELQADDDILETLVRRSCEIKADVVRRDEREGGLRAILNFGHTMGHAIEQVTGYGLYLHGEAIAVGMVYAARLSEKRMGFSSSDTARLIRILRHLDLPVDQPDVSWSDLMTAMQRDKKKKKGAVGFVLARQLGQVEFGCPVPVDLLASVWGDS